MIIHGSFARGNQSTEGAISVSSNGDLITHRWYFWTNGTRDVSARFIVPGTRCSDNLTFHNIQLATNSNPPNYIAIRQVAYDTPQVARAGLVLWSGPGGYDGIAPLSLPVVTNIFAVDCKGTIRIGPKRGFRFGTYDDELFAGAINNLIEETVSLVDLTFEPPSDSCFFSADPNAVKCDSNHVAKTCLANYALDFNSVCILVPTATINFSSTQQTAIATTTDCADEKDKLRTTSTSTKILPSTIEFEEKTELPMWPAQITGFSTSRAVDPTITISPLTEESKVGLGGAQATSHHSYPYAASPASAGIDFGRLVGSSMRISFATSSALLSVVAACFVLSV